MPLRLPMRAATNKEQCSYNAFCGIHGHGRPSLTSCRTCRTPYCLSAYLRNRLRISAVLSSRVSSLHALSRNLFQEVYCLVVVLHPCADFLFHVRRHKNLALVRLGTGYQINRAVPLALCTTAPFLSASHLTHTECGVNERFPTSKLCKTQAQFTFLGRPFYCGA